MLVKFDVAKPFIADGRLNRVTFGTARPSSDVALVTVAFSGGLRRLYAVKDRDCLRTLTTTTKTNGRA